MNTAEFIVALFNADPSGEAEVVVAPMPLSGRWTGAGRSCG
jgi:hypothetical protein